MVLKQWYTNQKRYAFSDTLKPYILQADAEGTLATGRVLPHASAEMGLTVIMQQLQLQLNQWQVEGYTGEVLLYVHGGLREEAFSLAFAQQQLAYCLARHIYPIFVTWHTGTQETLRYLQQDLTTNRVAVSAFLKHPLALPHWGWQKMKQHAALLSQTPEGALFQLLNQVHYLQQQLLKPVPLHWVGHSAGSIVLGHAVQYWCETLHNSLQKVSLLGAAITCDAFETLYGPALQNNRLQRVQCVNLSARSELLFHPSLLYLVAYLLDSPMPPSVFELCQPKQLSKKATRLLGMHRHVVPLYGEQLEQLHHKWSITPERLTMLWVDRADELFHQGETPLSWLDSNHAVLDKQFFQYVIEH
jgi:hypothetical protein